ncbi:DUF2071 domain-containing protein [Telluria mixta]|uniref:DUF2071 domain-containing protein n=1 Tax=Telluria mixta TaxID=34071 RepID=A0ABT2BRM3_9BURK|nr:DUF2071 domain-containing protein [Telluria mixta]MCS0627760.1 DUF2071 domain-containing protein [Telluria mixta]WEM94119.1 DUF2071 domain-containing protein [Telluria mixta]
MYRHPFPGLPGRVLEGLLNARGLARLRHAVFSRLPFPVLQSDVADVVYVTWMVDARAAAALLPAGLRVWEHDGRTPLTVLTYRHGHFGPVLAGPLRRLFPSPLQSNWRLYLDGPLPPGAPQQTVWFLENMMDSGAYVAVTRLFSDIMRTHRPARFTHGRAGNGFATRIEPGAGSAPALAYTVAPGAQPVLPPAFAAAFGSWDDAVKMLACQDAALGWSARLGKPVLSHIDLPVPLDAVQPLVPAGPVACSLLDNLPAAGEPLCFLVPRVPFRVLSEVVV